MPSAWGNLTTSLTWLDMSHNSLTSIVPSTWKNLYPGQLTTLHLTHNLEVFRYCHVAVDGIEYVMSMSALPPNHTCLLYTSDAADE